MEDRDWLILKILYTQKNISKAAQNMYISQPTLTKRLQHLEEEFGVRIVTRGMRGVQFTPQGEYLAKRAEEMLCKLQEIKDSVLNMESEVAGTLRIGASNYFSNYKLPGLLKLFKERYPQVEYQVTTGWSRDVFSSIYNRDVQIGFVRGDYSWRGEKHLLFVEKLCIASKDKIQLDDLPNLPRINYRTDILLKMLVDNWWAENYSVPPHVVMDVDQGETCKEMVLNGLGYAIIPSSFINDLEDIHKIDLRDAEGKPVLRKTWMFYHKEALELKVVQEFVNFVQGLTIPDTI